MLVKNFCHWRKNNRHDSQDVWPKYTSEDIQWFLYQSIILNTSNCINRPDEHFQSLLKVLLMFKIRIWYYDAIVQENVPDAVGIICINCGKTIGCLLYNQPIERFITPFVTNMVLQNISLSWIVQSTQELDFYFQNHCPSWILNGTWYNTKIFHNRMFHFWRLFYNW